MADIAEVLARPEVIRFVDDLVYWAAKLAGVSDVHSKRIATGLTSRLEAGEKIDQLVSIGQAFRRAALEEASSTFDGIANENGDVDLVAAKAVLRNLASDPHALIAPLARPPKDV